MNKKKGLSAFSVFLVAYSVLLCLIIAIGLGWVWNLLIDYEAGLPETTADITVRRFEASKIEETIKRVKLPVNEFENEDVLIKNYKELLQNKTVTYRRKGGEYTANHPVYNVFADDQVFAEFSLKQNGSNAHGFPNWELDRVVFAENVLASRSFEVKVPKGAEVYLNGVLADPAKYVSAKEEIALVKNIGEFVKETAGYEIYTVEGLMEEPEVEVKNCLAAERQQTENGLFYDYASADALLAENDELIHRFGENYGGYLINRVGFGTLSNDLIGPAREKLADIPAIWAYLWEEQYTHQFSNWSITNGRQYGEDCFSCDLSFSLDVTYRVTRTISYETKLSCVFVRKDGAWVIADFIMG